MNDHMVFEDLSTKWPPLGHGPVAIVESLPKEPYVVSHTFEIGLHSRVWLSYFIWLMS